MPPRGACTPGVKITDGDDQALCLRSPIYGTMVRFGQIVVGPPGSGKTTYCHGMYQYLKAIGRDAAVINLDPANHGEGLPYTPAVDIEELVSLEGVMSELDLGPNGAMIYCLEYLEKNMDWLMEKVHGLSHTYLIFDFPGQVELFTHCFCVQNIVQRLQKDDVRLAAVHLVDAYHCGNASVFISAALLSLMVMLRLELPHINVLSKVDLVEQMGPLPFNLDFFTECQDMRQLLAYLDAPPNMGDDDDRIGHQSQADSTEPSKEGVPGEARRDESGTHEDACSQDRSGEGGFDTSEARLGGGETNVRRKKERFFKMTEEICDVVDSYGLVCFYPLNIQDAETVGRVLSQIDKCNGYILGAHDTGGSSNGGGGNVSKLFRTAFSDTHEPMFEKVGSVQERYMPDTYGSAPPELLVNSAAAGRGAEAKTRSTGE